MKNLHIRRNQKGVTTLEYIVLGAVLVLGVVAALVAFKGQVNTAIGNEGTAIEQIGSGKASTAGEKFKD